MAARNPTRGYHLWDVRDLKAGIAVFGQNVREQAEDALHEVIEEGAGDMHGAIFTAVTATGERRLARGDGGVAGRYETGRMAEAVEKDVYWEDGVLIGRFGWLSDYDEYFSAQEDGTAKIEGMNALGGAFIRGEDRLQDHLKRITGV